MSKIWVLPDKSGLISNKTLNDKYQISSNLEIQNPNIIKSQIPNSKFQILLDPFYVAVATILRSTTKDELLLRRVNN